jgi:uncharacterized protein YdaU (DUF1376 family)
VSRAWMPLYIADYLADTRHLSTLEHGAYLLLIMHYWQHGGLPTDERQLARIAGLQTKEWNRSRPQLIPLFGSELKHKRIDAELERQSTISKAYTERAKKGAEAKWAKRDASSIHKAMLENAQSHKKRIDNISNTSTPREPDTPRPFPEDGSIAFSSPFAEIARRQGRGADPDVLASAFRRFCREREIDFASPQIAAKFETFCGKHRIRGLHA